MCRSAPSDFGASTRPAAGRQAGQHGAGLGQRVLQAAPGGGQRGGDRLALVLGEFAEMQQPVDEQAQAEIGRQPAGRGMRREQQAGLGQVRHDVADGRRRQVHRQPARQGAAADRLAGFDVLLDDLAQHGGRTGIEARRQRDARGEGLIHLQLPLEAREAGSVGQAIKVGTFRNMTYTQK